ncbi:MAG: hypothetical protein AAF713_19025 [Pseudomonadota bacterium]
MHLCLERRGSLGVLQLAVTLQDAEMTEEHRFSEELGIGDLPAVVRSSKDVIVQYPADSPF